MSARLSDVEHVHRTAAQFVRPVEPRSVAGPLLLLAILALVGIPTLLLLAHAVGWRNDVAVLLLLAGAGIGYYLRGAV